MSKTQKLHSEALKIIPGGSQLYSKRAELYSVDWPAYCEKAHGIQVTDLDGSVYKDFSTMGLGACVLGYRDSDVDNAVLHAICKGSASSLNTPEEVELAKLMLTLHSWADQVRFTRSGGEAIAVAIRIAQQHTGREAVLIGSYHGWHVNDPRKLEYTHYPYYKFLPECVEELADWDRAAALIIEPFRLKEPAPGYLERVRELTKKNNIVLIFDEISSGFRFNLGGVHLSMGVQPDIAVFSKAIGNGYPIGAVIGTRDVMKAAEDTFISSTTWSERTGFAAAIATIQKFWAYDVHEHLQAIGAQVKAEMPVPTEGRPAMLHFDFGSRERATLFTQLMLQRGYLATTQFYPSYAHTLEDVKRYLEAVNEVMPLLETERLTGPVAQKGIRR